MPDYYPEFYRQRRQRELAYRRATIAVVGFVVLLLAGAAVGYFILNMVKTRGTQPGASPELAKQQAKLQIDQKLADAHPPQASQAAAQPSVDVRNLKYGESFPTVKVAVQGSDASQATPVQGAPGAPAGTPPATGRIADAGTGTTAPGTASPTAPASPGTIGPQPPASANQAVAPSPAARVTPTDDAAKKKAAADKKKADDKAKRDAERKTAQQDKQDQADAKPAAATQAEQDAAKAAAAAKPVPAKAQSFVYTVYAGTYLSRDKAEQAKEQLSKATGLSGSVLDAKTGDYLVIVTHVKDEAEAYALRDKLREQGFGSAFATRKSQ